MIPRPRHALLLAALLSGCSGAQTTTKCLEPCASGLVCVSGACVPQTCSADSDCASPFSCVQGFCADDSCNPPCQPAQVCLSQVCVPKPVTACSDDSDCSNDESCLAGYCTQTGCTPTCNSGQVCLSQVCVPTSGNSCASPYITCQGYCANVETDSANCGGCGEVCPSGEVCNGAGSCAVSCLSTETQCGDLCVDVQTDATNCGFCGTACTKGQTCSGGTCAATCAEPFATCGVGTAAYCADTVNDPANCGTCGNRCSPSEVCLASVCTPFTVASTSSSGGVSATSTASSTASAAASSTGTNSTWASSTGTGTSTSTSTATANSTAASSSSSGSASTAGASSSSGGASYPDAGTCLIGGVIYGANQFSPTSQCVSCQPWVSTANFSRYGGASGCGIDAGGCTIDGVAVPAFPGNGAFNPNNGCQACVPTTSTTAWTALANGATCGDGTCGGGTCNCYNSVDCVANNACDQPVDDQNCGGCGLVCGAGTFCANGSCVPPPVLSVPRSKLTASPSQFGSGLVMIGGVNDAGPTAAVESFGKFSTSWAALPSLPVARYGVAAGLTSGVTIYAAGGVYSDGGSSGISNEVDTLYNPGNTWTTLSTGLPIAVDGAAGLSPGLNLTPILFGGVSDAGVIGALQQDVPDSGLTEFVVLSATLPQPLGGAMLLVFGPGFGVLGGVDSSGTPSAHFWLLDYGSYQSSALQPWPRPRVGASAAIDENEQIYVTGGLLPDGGFSDQLDIYNPYANSWSVGPPLPTPRTDLACAYVFGHVFCAGGYNGQFLDTVEVYSTALQAWAHQ